MVELGAAGMCDGPPDFVGLVERLRKLERSREAWKSSVWFRPEGSPHSSRTVELSGNLAMFEGLELDCSEYLFLRFPSEARGIPERVWYLDLDWEGTIAAFVSTIRKISSFSQG
jgi:hypothetical protein